MVLARPDARWFTPPLATAEVESASLALRFLGTAGFTVRWAGRTLVLDPFLSRPGVLRTLLGRLRPDSVAIERHVPDADDVLVGHAHHDHVLDAPELCRRTGARLIGSRDVAHVAQAAGLPGEQMQVVSAGDTVACGPVTVRALQSRHGRVYGRVPFPGSIPAPPPWPARLRRFRHGEVLSWHLEGPGASVVHVDSADYVDEALEGVRADVLCACAIGWTWRPKYVEGLIERLRPRYVVPCHWDSFFGPVERAARVLPFCRLGGFLDAIRTQGSTPVLLEPLAWWAPARGLIP